MKQIFFFYLILIFCFISVSAQTPQLPMLISGNVSINNNVPPVDSKIIAKADNNIVADAKISPDGQYSLLLQQMEKGKTVRFYVDGIDTKAEVDYESGDYRNIDIKVETKKKSDNNVYIVAGGLAALLVVAATCLIWKNLRE